jgi:hypothetical protein
MLTDIFADRYLSIQMWETFGEPEKRFLVQGYRMINELLFSYWIDGKESESAKKIWEDLHVKLSMELGLKELSPVYYSYQSTWNGKPHNVSRKFTMEKVCEKFICADCVGATSADRFIKERLSFIELAFRKKEETIKTLNSELPQKISEAKIRSKSPPGRGTIRIPGDPEEGMRAWNKTLNDTFKSNVEELNERLRRAGFKLNYHNGFIQVSEDELIENQIENEFWALTNKPLWENVDIDMKEAIDLRDSGGRDPSFYSARALESAIKIISDQKQWSTGNEKGAHNYIENLGSKKNGEFIKAWERDALKAFFTSVRNPFGHGPGSEDMPKLSAQQTDWAIETCMSWIKSLIKRHIV